MSRSRSAPVKVAARARSAALALAVLALAGCGGRGAAPSPTRAAASPSPQPMARPAVPSVVSRDERTLRTQSYTPDRYAVGSLPSGQRLVVIHSVCTGSADGHCQAIAVFRGSDPRPVWTGHYSGVTAFAAYAGGFSVTSVQYAPSDPLCCPSRPPVTQRYRWNGKEFALMRPGSQSVP